MIPPSAHNDPNRPLGPEGEKELVAFGQWLRSQREIREITLEEIASATNIGKRYLIALEEGKVDVLPGPIFVRGFLRQYAGFTGLDPDEAVNTFTAAQRADEDLDIPAPSRARGPGPGRWGMGLLLAAAVVLLVGVVVGLTYYADWAGMKDSDEPESPPISVPPATAKTPIAPPVVEDSSEAEAALSVTLDFLDSCWVEAVIDDDRTLSEVRVQGESLQIEAMERVLLSVDKVAAVRIEVNGEPLPIEPDEESEGVRDLEILAPEPEAETAPKDSVGGDAEVPQEVVEASGEIE